MHESMRIGIVGAALCLASAAASMHGTEVAEPRKAKHRGSFTPTPRGYGSTAKSSSLQRLLRKAKA